MAEGSHPTSALATADQRRAEERALAIFATDKLQAARAETLAHFRADPNAALPDQDHLIGQSVSEHYFHAALMAASEDSTAPSFVWTLAHDHHWMGMHVLGSRFGQDNSDNCYRLASIDPRMRYRIKGQFASGRPCDFSICALPGQPGENILANVVALIDLDDIDLDADRCFSIEVDADPTDGRRNHLCIARARMLFVRDTLAKWSVETPCALQIEPLQVAAEREFHLGSASSRAADLGNTIARYMLKELQHGIFERGPLNALNPPWAAGKHGGLVTQASALGHYRLGVDDALIVTADRLDARYMGMQITDIWMLSYEYRHRTSSLNHAQAAPDADGRFRWVISRRDPGVHNWLDGGGNGCGTILLRWQHLPAGRTPAGANAVCELMKLSDVRGCLPRDTCFLSEMERAAQRARRLSAYQCRIA
ncbi:MAG: hypothetical protein EPO08_04815 [Rhodospirillaceae bacterium]|nr:MAG: hypothetical protein EPO08_04815 [Rhodospirillaceae bacterium]